MFQHRDYRKEIRKTVVGRPGGETLDRGESSPIEWRPEAASVRWGEGRSRAAGNGGRACGSCPTLATTYLYTHHYMSYTLIIIVLHSSQYVLYTHHQPTLYCEDTGSNCVQRWVLHKIIFQLVQCNKKKLFCLVIKDQQN